MFLIGKFLLVAAAIGWSLQEEEALTEEELHGKFLAIARCETQQEHMCPSGLCTVKSALNGTNKPHNHWTPAEHFCNDICRLNDGCRTICECADRNQKSKTVLSISKQRRLFTPTLHCREPSLISITWNYSRDSTEVETIVYAVEMLAYGDLLWKPYSLTRKNIAVVEGLLPRQKYQFRVFAVGPSGIIDMSTVSESISTLPPVSDVKSEHLVLHPPVSVEQIGPIKYTNKRASVRFGWKPGQNATCTYEVIIMSIYTDKTEVGGEAGPIEETYDVAEKPMEGFGDNLFLGQKYDIRVRSRINGSEVESDETVGMTLSINNCLAAFDHNLTVCRPPAPAQVNITAVQTADNANEATILISWTRVKGHPAGYNVSLYDPDMKLIVERLVPGTDTVARFQNIPIKTRYHAKVSADSPAGRGDVNTKMGKLNVFDSKNMATQPVTERPLMRNTSSNPLTEGNGRPIVSVERTEHSDYLGIYLSVGGAVVVITTFVALLRFISMRMRRKPTKIPELGEQRGSESISSESAKLEESDLHLCEQIGEGTFGTVCLGLLSEPSSKETIKVAVKMLRENPSAEDCRHFDNEMLILRSVKPHPNVVRFIGCVTQTPEKKILMEYCEFGDLQSFLNKNWKDLIEEHSGNLNSSNAIEPTPVALGLKMYRNCPALANNTYGVMLGADRKQFSAELMSFARQVASGMEFLTDSGILHRDLAARNVLIAGDRSIRISDFGLSREVLENSVYRKLGCERVAIKWIAPEALESRIFTTKCDVWSYGILLWEVVTLGSSPYASIDNVLECLRKGYRMPRPCNCSQDLYEWMRRCWEKNPEDRPTFQLLREHMENLECSGDQHILLDNDKISTFKTIRPTDLEERG